MFLSFRAKSRQKDRKSSIIKYIEKHGFISNKEARELLGLADSTTKRIFRDMVDEGLLILEGERKNRRYF